MTYVKKREYGPAELVAGNVRVLESPHEAIAQYGSRLTLNGEAVPGQDVDVDELYRTAMRPELRR